MARRDDIPKDDSYSSTVRKVLVTSNGSEATSDNPLPINIASGVMDNASSAGYVKLSDGETALNLYELKQEETQDLLKDVLKELKIMNMHLMVLTDNEFKHNEIE